MRFVFTDPYALHVDAGAELKDLELSCEAGLDAVKGQGYREVGVRSNRRKGRSK